MCLPSRSTSTRCSWHWRDDRAWELRIRLSVKSPTMKRSLTIAVACVAVGIFSLTASEPRDGEPYRESQIPAHYRRWQTAKDAPVSVIVTTEKTTFAAAEGITIRCAVRNNTDKPITILRPFGDEFFAHSTGLSILGPGGVVGYSGPQKDYVLGTGSFMELAAKSVVEDAHTIPKDHYTEIDKPGLYVIEYRYLSNGYPTQPPPDNFWTGFVDSNPVTVVVK